MPMPCAPNLMRGDASHRVAGRLTGPSDMAPEVWAKVKDHPCYSEEAHHYFARMHVAVAPACNIQCNYCNRKYDCSNESRPGVVSEKLTPEQAMRKVVAVANEVPQLSVLGIAGPGDACYDWRKTKATFEAVVQKIPDIKLCISTNGLALPDHVDEIMEMNIDHVTITINMVDPAGRRRGFIPGSFTRTSAGPAWRPARSCMSGRCWAWRCWRSGRSW